jgi:hypothetical protein
MPDSWRAAPNRSWLQVPSAQRTKVRTKVSDEPVASAVDAMQRRWELDHLQDYLTSLQRKPERTKTRVDRTRMANLARAVSTVQKHLAVWEVQNS